MKRKLFSFTQETIDRALSEFDLIDGAGTESDRTACAMTLLTWMCGRRWDRRKKEWVEDGPTKEWSDHPECASPLVASLTIRANDHTHTTKEMRRELVKLGVKGALDTWWLPGVVIAKGQELIVPANGEVGEDPQDIYLRAMRLLKYITWWKQNGKPRPDLLDAVLTRAVLTDAVLTDAVLTRAVLTRAVLTDADLTDADLHGANFSGARGRPVWGAPPGWKIDERGIWLRDC
jgi:hypothetical protein